MIPSRTHGDDTLPAGLGGRRGSMGFYELLKGSSKFSSTKAHPPPPKKN